MKAEDTIIPLEYSTLDELHCASISDEKILRALKEQAEISFKAGIREVVERIMANSMVEKCDPEVMAYFEDYRWMDEHDWQSKLKEWGDR